MIDNLQDRLRIPDARLNEINALLLNPDSRVTRAFLDVVRKYGTPERSTARPKRPAACPICWPGSGKSSRRI